MGNAAHVLLLAVAVASCSGRRAQGPKPPEPSVAVVPRPMEQEPSPKTEPEPNGGEGVAQVEYLTPCVEGSAEHAEAAQMFRKLGERVEAMAPDDDSGPVLDELRRLLEHPCLRLAASDTPELSAGSGLSLRTWWDAGGDAWVGHYLHLDERDSDDVAYSWVAPTMRKALSRETNPDHPLGSLLCSVHDEICDPGRQGWIERAEVALRRHAVERDEPRLREADPEPASCAQAALAAKSNERYQTWRQCLNGQERKLEALPLGGIRVPTEGWLVVRGRRGHYNFCDEIRAYDLRTGAAFVSQSCSGLALTQGGGVDHRKTDDARKPSTTVGRLPLGNLREAAWMILNTNEVQSNVLAYGFGQAKPEGVEPRLPAGGTFGGGVGGFSFSTAQTRLRWYYVVGGNAIVGGELTWPEDYNSAAKDHAVRLLRIAELGLEEGCPPARLPRLDLDLEPAGVSGLDADAESLRNAKSTIEQALDGLRKIPACRRRPR